MKLKEITLRGFRGFNVERSIPIHDRLTLIFAPNSHGKTSISEGFEWLLYGYTSKVQFADSKDEYKGSYRNIHLLQPESPTVKIIVQDGASSKELQALLSGSGAVLRVDGSIVDSWPFSSQLATSPKPFILQHALKDLLLAAPVDRFNRFAALLGFEELTQVHKDLMAFCTKPPVPSLAKELNASIDGLILRLQADPQLVSIVRSIRKGHKEIGATRSLIKKQARSLTSANTADANLLTELVKRRDEAISKVFQGSVFVSAFDDQAGASLVGEEKALLALVTTEVPALFTKLVAQSAQHNILREAQFYGLGLELLEQVPAVCPFCDRALTAEDLTHIQDRHGGIVDAKQAAVGLEVAQKALEQALIDLSQRISEYYKRVANRVKALLDAREAMPQLRSLLVGKNESHLTVVVGAMQRYRRFGISPRRKRKSTTFSAEGTGGFHS